MTIFTQESVFWKNSFLVVFQLFFIHNKFYTNQNFTLTYATTCIYSVSPTKSPINAHYTNIDFQSQTHFFSFSTLDFKDVNTLLQTISETNVMHDQLSSLFHHSDSSCTFCQLSYALDTTTSALKNVFFPMLSSITNPVASFLFAVIFIFFLVWQLY